MHIVSTYFSHYVVFALYNIFCRKYSHFLDFHEVTEMLSSAFALLFLDVLKMSPPPQKKHRTYQTVEFVYHQHTPDVYLSEFHPQSAPTPWICLSGLDAHRKTLISWPHTVMLNQQKAKVYLQAC